MSLRKVLLASVVLLAGGMGPVSAETIQGAMAKAYKFNSQLNSARAGLRSTDENVAIAKSGYRPVIVARGGTSYSSSRTTQHSGINERQRNSTQGSRVEVGSFGIQLSQSLFDGFQTRNNVKTAKANVMATRESLRNTEQNILLNAATAYMDVIRDRQIAALTQQNLAFLDEQVRAAQSRFDVGEGTRTDVAQAQAERASAIASLNDAKARVMQSSATYRQVIGEDPGKLTFPKTPSKMLPKSAAGAQAIAAEEHPAIAASEHLIDAAGFTVKSLEGQLLPQVDGTISLEHQYTGVDGNISSSASWQNSNETSASIGAQLTIPLYQGGRVAAQIRQNKEELGQARINLDVNRDNVRANVTTAWSFYNASSQSAQANRTVVEARRLALNGVIEERNVGQRTTLDVLNAQADVIQAQIDLASDEHDIIVNAYGIVSSIGRMNGKALGINVSIYKPEEHYEAVKDKWFGLRTPDGR